MTARTLIGKGLKVVIIDERSSLGGQYFKQLAKFSSNAGATNFQVEKKVMYKPVFSRSFEYVIYISF